jgi:enterochelin esterase family protein
VQLDPLNAKTYRYHPQSPGVDEDVEQHGFLVSLLELPQAPAQTWLIHQPKIPKGKTEQHVLQSTTLNNEHRLWVYTPAGYQTDREPYDLLILFDAWAYVYNMQATVTMDNLIHAGKIPPVVAVFLDSPDRMQEFLCHAPFADFLAQELIPWLRQGYNVTHESDHTIIGGLSAGGLAAAYTGLRYPNIFGKVLVQSAALWWRPENEIEPEWLARQYETSPRLPLRFYLEVGMLEDYIEGDEGASQFTSTRHFRDVLNAKGYPVHYSEFSGDHDEVCWQGTLADALIELLNKV